MSESKTPVHAQVSLRSAEGETLGARTILLPGHRSRRVPVALILGSAAVDFIGALTIQVQEPEAAMKMAFAAQLPLIGGDALAGTSIDEELEMPKMGSDFKSVVDSGSAFLAVQNAGMEEASASVTCFASGASAVLNLQVPPNSMRFVYNCQPLSGNLTSAAHVLPDLPFHAKQAAASQAGKPAAFEVKAGMSELTVFGLSAASGEKDRIGGAILVDRSDFTSRSTVFAGIPVGAYSALPGSVFTPSLAMANLTNAVRTVSIRAAFEGSLSPPRVLGTIALQPFETHCFEMPPQSSDAPTMVNIMADQDGLPSDVVFSLSDKDSVTAAAALKPLPKFLTHANNGGGHPWSLRPGTSSTLVLFNARTKKQLVNLNLGADGIGWSKTVTLQPNQTLTMPI